MAAAIKAEDAVPTITKTEPDGDASAPFADDDDDAYEDTGELEMPKELPKAWLTKVPRPLYDNWAAVDDDEPVQLGVVRRFKASGKCHLVLHAASKYNHRVPLEYDMRIHDPPAGNTYIFSEKDLPEYKSKTRSKKPPLAPQSQAGLRKDDRYRPWRRKVVPKQTALAAGAANEATCFALENEDYRRIMAQRIAEEQASKPGIQLLVGDARLYGASVLPSEGKVSRPVAVRAEGGFDTFVKTGAPKAKVQENKASRIPHNDLLDLIFDCFKDYRYWSMKALRDKINQPHDYLRSTVAEVADLVRSGPFYGLYTLKKDFEHKVPEPRADQEAPKREGGDSSEDEGDEDVDDDDVEMEDVYPA